MNLQLDTAIAKKFISNSQKIRVMTENWVARNLFCPICGKAMLHHYEANRPVADFCCENCNTDFELKSKSSANGELGKRIADGAYSTMIKRITSNNNPHFFFLTYYNYQVNNFVIIPNHFFTPAIIEKREPLSDNAQRSGWVGCNINIEKIPNSGKIYVVKNCTEIDHHIVVEKFRQTSFLKTSNIESREWILDIMNCINNIESEHFTLQNVYAFEKELQQKHPDNNFIKDKIRQQLQYLRDKGFIEFLSRGNYHKLK
ncbi:MAG: DpnI domain-containing protein [Muribaculaceae bacterium]|nr:DpnI domain-containing protein [Muribaculaceae bacterium]